MNHDDNRALVEKMEEVREALLSRGFKVKFYDGRNVTFVHPNHMKATYLGTFLNSFSCLDYDEEPGKVYLWDDTYGIEEALVFVTPIYRSNGTSKNVNLRIRVTHNHWKLGDYVDAPCRHDLENPIFVRELKKSPTALFNGLRHTVSHVDCTCEYERKLNCDASARVTEKVVNSIVEAVEKFEIRDHSDVERNPKDFHECTRDTYFQWVQGWKARHNG